MTQTEDSRALERRAEDIARRVADLRSELRRCIIGQEQLTQDLLVGMFAGGHILLEGLPGLGKTLLVKSLAGCLGVDFGRIQFTPDLMPTDVLGTRIIDEHADGLQFRFEKGPVFTNLLLADEINRTTPKTQSALLQAMQEAQVTIGDTTHALPEPFCVIATQNPIELEGTYPLPEAQLDRFIFKLHVDTPPVDAMVRILDATTRETTIRPERIMDAAQVTEARDLARRILCGEHLVRYVAEILAATWPSAGADSATQRSVRYGASPRAGQAMIVTAKVRALLDGRPSVSRDDIDTSVLPSLRHRIVLGFDAESDGSGVESLLPAWLERARRQSAS